MEENLLLSAALVIVLGVAAQWAAWRVRMPSILLLLIIGFLAGPVWGAAAGGRPLIDPDAMLGGLLFPVVSLSVAVILFEGGLTLRFHELRRVGGVVIAIVTVGALVTWAAAAAAAKNILGMPTDLAVLLGAILVVTGPTVIGPLLRDIRPSGNVASVLKWEGIVIDPIGAILAVLVFEAIMVGNVHDAAGAIAMGLLKLLGVGAAIGLAGSLLLFVLLRRYLLPDFLHNPVSLMMVVGVFTAANLLFHESGLVAVTVMGMGLANQKSVDVAHIVEFKENLRVLLISSLFILLASRVSLASFADMGPSIVVFLAVLFFVARPLSVLVSTSGARLHWKEKIFLAWMAPRGIVAAAVASIFALRLESVGRTDASALVPFTFITIVATVTVYGLTAPRLARRLGLSQDRPQGLLILGANSFATSLGSVIRDAGFDVVIVDNNWMSTTGARMAGLSVFYGSILTECAVEEINLGGIGRLLALTSNDEVNSLAALHWSEKFGRREVYQLPPEEAFHRCHQAIAPLNLRGRYLFHKDLTHPYLIKRMDQGAAVKATHLTEEFTWDDLVRQYAGRVIPLMHVNEKRELIIHTTDYAPRLRSGHRVICLIDPTKKTSGGSANRRGPENSNPKT